MSSVGLCAPTRSPSALLPTFFGEGSSTKIDDGKKGKRILTSLLEDLAICWQFKGRSKGYHPFWTVLPKNHPCIFPVLVV